MRSKNELFMDVVNWLIDEGYAKSQGDVAEQASLGANIISRIKNGKVKEVSEDTIRAIVSRFKMLNIDYLRGKSEQISNLYEKPSPQPSQIDQSSLVNANISVYNEMVETLKDRLSDKEETITSLKFQIAKLEHDLEKKDSDKETISSLKGQLTGKDETIKLFKSQLVDKDKQINRLEHDLADKDKYINRIENDLSEKDNLIAQNLERISELKNQIAILYSRHPSPADPLADYPFPIGTSEPNGQSQSQLTP